MNASDPNETSPRRTPSYLGDRPDVVIFPPALPLGAIVLSVLLGWLFPQETELPWLSGLVGKIVAALILAGGLIIMVGSRRALVHAGTNVDPRQPTLRLVTSWPFNWSRNPMYLGGNIAALGLALLFRLHWMLLLYPVAMVICHYGVVLREEAYLERKFGAEYRAYKFRVRRWL